MVDLGPDARQAVPYARELAESICDAFAEGASLAGACAEQVPPVPLEDVIGWSLDEETRDEWAQLMADACEAAADVLYDELCRVADEEVPAIGERRDAGFVTWKGARMRWLRWMVERLHPDRFAPAGLSR